MGHILTTSFASIHSNAVDAPIKQHTAMQKPREKKSHGKKAFKSISLSIIQKYTMTDHAHKFAPHELYELSEPIHDLRKLYPRLKRGKDNKSKKCFIHDQHEVDAILAGEGEMEFSKHISKQCKMIPKWRQPATV